MPISWNEIKNRAIAFSKEWADEISEDAEAKSFWDGFFHVFGISRRRVATFEQRVQKIDQKQGFIDLLWKGMILVEHKSRGKDLDKAYQQAKDYFPGLKEHELPRYILVSDFERFRLYDLETNNNVEFALKDFVQYIQLFGFIAGYEKRTYKEEDPVNIKAAEQMGKLHDRLEEVGYKGHHLEVYLVRLLFCLFADDTSIFERGIFQEYIDRHTKEDGSDLAMHLANIFQVLNTPKEARLTNLDETLKEFPYVNGKLFEEHLPLAAFDSQMREMLLEACGLNWSKISPAIFGSMFQAVMNPQERRNLGAHYTSEKNILKLIKPLFLDELHAEFTKAKGNKNKLNELHKKLASLRFLDPACGCGNFLIITYRELRLLEIDILRELYGKQQVTAIDAIINIDVDQFYGIEYDEFPARVAEVAMWLMDHQMNQKVSEEFGLYYVRLPLRKSATILHGNALRTDWAALIEPGKQLHYILGNPPFVGTAYQNAEQKADMALAFDGIKSFGMLDYVAAWYIKAAQLIQNTKIKAAFVSTNSISQGEQVSALWNEMFNRYHIKIHFAHRTFSWTNEARGMAAVHVVIIGFANFDVNEKYIYEYENIKGEPHEIKAKNINPYLVEGRDIFIQKRTNPICNVPSISRGSDAIDDGNLLLNLEEKEELIKQYPEAEKYIRPFLMAREFLHNIPRFCLWLKNVAPNEIKKIPPIYERIEKVKSFREKSKRLQTLKAAKFPSLFGEERQPNSDYLAIPKVSSENREYLPIGFCSKEIICGDKLFNLPNANFYIFGVLTSLMHMTWVKYVCGRLKSDISYSNTIVYNNFPFPQSITEAQRRRVEEAAQAVLDVRASFMSPAGGVQGASLADLYDPLTMPPALVKAHQALDKAVDLCYRPQPFTNELSRIEFLFHLYEQYTQPLLATQSKKQPNPKG